ncbi:MAG: CotH kinase family protein, partial [Muribaculaceae bacterium]|nr:CotH kinase family protein [Muribaculaceae bacterium]
LFIRDCTLTVVSADSKETCTELPMGIRGRGNSTWGMAKKPYRVKFDSKTNFLDNKAKAKSWVFLANYADKSLIRNALAFEISSYVGLEYTPSIKFVDLVLNGEYQGNYMVTDQTEVAKNRVPVEEQEPTDTAEPEITGGYLLEIDGFADGEPVWFGTPQGLKITVKYPKDDEINPEQLDYITRYINDFENILFSDSFTDAEEGYRSMVDMESLVNWYIACELTANSDCFWSTYIYKKREDPKIYFGPMWDYDIAFNNDNRLGDTTNKLMREHAHNPRTWIQRLWKDESFRTAVNTRWKELVEQGIEQHLLDRIDYYAEMIDASQTLNFQKWNILNNRVYLENQIFSDYEGYISYLREFVSGHVAFLTESFDSTDPTTKMVEVDTEATYMIRHSGGCYITEVGNGCKVQAYEDASRIQFQAQSSPYVYAIRFESGNYLGSDKGWTSQIFDSADDEYAHFTVEKSSDAGYVIIKNIGRDRYLGTDNNSEGSSVYTDKSGNDPRHLWKLIKLEESALGLPGAQSAVLTFDGRALLAADGAVIEVFDITGCRVLAAEGARTSVAPLASGIYIATATFANGESARLKFIKP